MPVSAVRVSTAPFQFEGDTFPLSKLPLKAPNPARKRVAKKHFSRSTAKKVSPVSRLQNPQTAQQTAEARVKLALEHRSAARKLALSMISKWKCRIENDELQSVIDLALCESAMRFDKRHGASFMTFFYYHLKGKLIRTIAERADRSIVYVENYDQPRPMQLGDEESSDVCSTEWLNLCAAADPFAAEDAMYRQQIVDICYKACQRLRGIEREVIWRLYFENKELNQLTTELGYSRGHLFRVRMRALGKIRRAVAAHV